jgi:hypothetical protein
VFVLAVTIPSEFYSYNESSTFGFLISEAIMGNSLHNKIYLGRRHAALNALSTKRVQALLLFTAVAGAALAWFAIQALK